jgi:hypothetical protein
MAARATQLRWIRLLPASLFLLALLALPAAASASDEAVAGPAIASVAVAPATPDGSGLDRGPAFVLVVAGSIGILAALSGVRDDDAQARRSAPHPRRHAR